MQKSLKKIPGRDVNPFLSGRDLNPDLSGLDVNPDLSGQDVNPDLCLDVNSDLSPVSSAR